MARQGTITIAVRAGILPRETLVELLDDLASADYEVVPEQLTSRRYALLSIHVDNLSSPFDNAISVYRGVHLPPLYQFIAPAGRAFTHVFSPGDGPVFTSTGECHFRTLFDAVVTPTWGRSD